MLCRLRLGGREGHGALLHIRIDRERVAGNHFAVEQLHGERVLDEPLDGALQRPRSELRIVALAEEQFVSFLRQRDLDLALGEEPAEVLKLQVDDLLDFRFAEGVEDHDFIDAVQELRAEVLEKRVLNLLLQPLAEHARFAHRASLLRGHADGVIDAVHGLVDEAGCRCSRS